MGTEQQVADGLWMFGEDLCCNFSMHLYLGKKRQSLVRTTTTR
jgi:hypothetical protein